MSSAVLRIFGRAVASVLVLGILVAPLAPIPDLADDGPVRYVEPVDAPVVDGFRAPAGPYGPGNRGLEYDTQPGQVVRAAAPGSVVFAGMVAGERHVTVLHDDGRRSSYSFLASIDVSTGQVVADGAPIGTAGELLHVGVREGDVYVDPAALFGTEVRSVRLVPENPSGSPTWDAAATEIQALVQLTLLEGGPGIVDRLRSGLGDASGWVWDHARDAAPGLLHLALWAGREVAFAYNPVLGIVVFDIAVPLALGEESPMWNALAEWSPHHVLVRSAERGMDWWRQRSECTPSDVSPQPPAERRVAVLVGGLGSTSSHAAVGALDVDALGYSPGDVVGFSYAGGRIPGTFDGRPAHISEDLSGIEVVGYGEEDSSNGLARRGVMLADVLQEVAASSPGTPIDLYGHSQGGLVLRLALAELSGRPDGPEVIAALGVVATMGTPHQGSDLATAALVAAGTGEGQVALQGIDAHTGLPVDPDQVDNLADLALGADLLTDLADQGLPAGPSYLSLGARGDLVVPDTRAEADGATHVTLPLSGVAAHEELPAHATTTRELGLALAGMDPTCRSIFDVAIDGFVAEGSHALHVRVGIGVAIGDSYSAVPAWLGGLAGD